MAMIEVKIVETNAPRLTQKTYTYPEFELLSDELKENQFVVFLLNNNGKDIYKGKFVKIGPLTVHEDIYSKIQERIVNNQIKKRTGQKFLDQLDKCFKDLNELVVPQSSFSPPFNGKAVEEQQEIEPEEPAIQKVPRKKIVFSLPFKVNTKVVLISICSCLLVSGITFGGYYYFSNKREVVAVKDEFSDLLQKKEYSKAAKQFPNKRIDIATYLAEHELFSDLKDYQKEFPTDTGAFDLAFYEKEWEKVISSPTTDLSEDKQIMLAHAYIELGKLSEAEILNKKLKSKVIEQELSYSYKVKAIQEIQENKISEAEQIQKKLNDSDLAELIDTAKICREMIEHYKKEKDVENQKIWLNKLESLGKELIPDESKKDNE